jgi:hypothetical protein
LDRVFAECMQGKTYPIKASDYDQTCDKDSDCTAVGEGDGCTPCILLCGDATINVADLQKWRDDVQKTPARASGTCHCPLWGSPECVDHKCQLSAIPQGPQNDCEVVGGKCVADGDGACQQTAAEDCASGDASKAATCCLDPLFAACNAGKNTPIKASNYEQNCNVDADCIAIGEGDGCNCEVNCQNAAINGGDVEAWRLDLAKTPAHFLTCHCPAATAPCCVDHVCSDDRKQCAAP